MEFLWQQIAVAPRFGSIASSTDSPLSEPIVLGPPGRRVERSRSYRRAPRGSHPEAFEVANPARFEAFAAVVQYSLAFLNDRSLTWAINREFERHSPMVHQIMQQHRDGGLLAVAESLVRWDEAQAFGPGTPGGRPPAVYFGGLAKRFVGLDVGTIVYARPENAYWHWQHASRMEPGAGESEYVDYTFFWGTWAQ